MIDNSFIFSKKTMRHTYSISHFKYTIFSYYLKKTLLCKYFPVLFCSHEMEDDLMSMC